MRRDKVVVFVLWHGARNNVFTNRHNDAIQCLEFNPVTNVLVSCTSCDFFFWSVEEKSVKKCKTPARINSCSWNSIGQYLALGLANGSVSIRNGDGDEKFLIESDSSGGHAPAIWALSFSPRR